MKPLLRNLLACPECKSSLREFPNVLTCEPCTREYPVVDGVPVFLPGKDLEPTRELPVRTGYSDWYYLHTMASLPRSSCFLDIGSGDMGLSHPNVIRMDIFLGPNVDVVADVYSMPFKEGSFDFVLSIAVLEHLADPFGAAREMRRVTRSGGYVYADTNFVFPYHPYPRHYFNFSIDGISEVFHEFDKIHVTVPPYLMPSQALQNVLQGYLYFFTPRNRAERRFYRAVRKLRDFPLLEFDSGIARDKAHIIAAGVCFYGRRPSEDDEGPIPREILGVYRRRPDLQAEFPNPRDLSKGWNLMTWAERHGRHEEPELAKLFETTELISVESLAASPSPEEPLRKRLSKIAPRARSVLSYAKRAYLPRRLEK